MNCSRSLFLSVLLTLAAAGQAQAKPLAKSLPQSLANSPKAIPIAVILPSEAIQTDLVPTLKSKPLAPAIPVQFDSPVKLDMTPIGPSLRPRTIAYWSPRPFAPSPKPTPQSAANFSAANFSSGLDATVLVALSRALPQAVGSSAALTKPVPAPAPKLAASSELPEFVAELPESIVPAATQTALNRAATQINGQFLTPSLRQALIEGSGLPQPKSVTPIDRRLGSLLTQSLGRSPSGDQAKAIGQLSRNLTGLTVNGHVDVAQLTGASSQLNGLLLSLSSSERHLLASEPSIAELIRVLAQLSLPLL
jgi:hypothetical protein